MSKRVILQILEGSFEQGFPVSLRIQDDNDPPQDEFSDSGKLPPAIAILYSFRNLPLNTMPIIWLLLREINFLAGILFLYKSLNIPESFNKWQADFHRRVENLPASQDDSHNRVENLPASQDDSHNRVEDLVVSRIFRHWQSVIFECFCSKGSRKQILGWRKNKDTKEDLLAGQTRNGSRAKPRKKFQYSAQSSAEQLKIEMNQWLNSNTEDWRKIRDSLQQRLSPSDEIRLIVQTSNVQLQQLPWQSWDLFNSTYKKTEIALALSDKQDPPVGEPVSPGASVRILAVMGSSNDINTEFDRQVLEKLKAEGADIEVLDLANQKANKRELIEQLRDEQGWHIFFFAGHSSSQPDGQIGWFDINQDESLAIEELKNSLSIAIEHGLQIAIFNSCDGLGLANQLATLYLPLSIIMREPIPDKVAQDFLEGFLTEFSGGNSLHFSVRRTRGILEDKWNTDYPGISWLPVICQNALAVAPPWNELWQEQKVNPPVRISRPGLLAMALASVVSTSLVWITQQMGILQPLELKAYDLMMNLRPSEPPDDRIAIVEVTQSDLDYQDREGMPRPDKAVSFSAIALTRLLKKLEEYQPALIGLDTKVEFKDKSTNLATQFKQMSNLVAGCGRGNPDNISLPPGILNGGSINVFSDMDDHVLRRQTYYLRYDRAEKLDCPGDSFNLVLAFSYLADRYPGQYNPQWISESASKTSSQCNPNGEECSLQFGEFTLKNLKQDAGGYQLPNTSYEILLNYRNYWNQEKQRYTVSRNIFSLEDILKDKIPPEKITNKIVLIGNTEKNDYFNDYHLTPYGEMPGVEIQAHMVSHIISAALRERPLLSYWPTYAKILWVFAWSLLGGIIAWCWCNAPFKLIISLIVTGIALSGFCYFSLVNGVWVVLIAPATALFLTSSAVNVYGNSREKLSK